MTTNRKPHVLKPAKGLSRPQNVIFFDTETSQDKSNPSLIRHSLRLGSALFVRFNYNGHPDTLVRFDFRDAPVFWAAVLKACRPKTTTYLVAHNFIFDLAVSDGFEQLKRLGFMLDSFYTKGVVSIFRWSKGNIKIIGLDNCNLFAGTLESWGEIFGYPKLKVDFDTVGDDKLQTYCARDVEIMYRSWRSWLSFLDTNDCGAFKITVGSTAINTWLHRFCPATVHIHNNPLALALEREAYHGGRVECFYQGRREDDHYYYLDINNMYGYVLKRYLYPAGLVDAQPCSSVSMLIRKLEKYAVIAKVVVNVSEPFYPHDVGGFTAYPLGSFETTLTTPELILALQRGWLESISFMSWYRQSSLFSDYVKEFYDLRQSYKRQGNAGYAQICKLLVNSLYGKFGQQGFEQHYLGNIGTDEYLTEQVFDFDKREYYRHVVLKGELYEERKTGESYNSFTAIAAHVTAYARLHLARLLFSIPPHHLFYCDTDSVIVDETGKRSLSGMLDETCLGFLKIEIQSDWLEINAPKDYAMEGRTKIKGVSKHATKNPDGSYAQLQWERLGGMIKRGNTGGFVTRWVTKHNQRRITSGMVDLEGWIHPFLLSEGQESLGEHFSLPVQEPLFAP